MNAARMTDIDVSQTHVVARSIGVATSWMREAIKLTKYRFQYFAELSIPYNRL